MSDNTKIEWTDATANAINGCTVVSPGCANCYAMKQAHRFPVRQGLTRPSPSGMTWTGEVRLNEAVFDQVLRWKRPRRIFWNAHGDTFHPSVPDEWIDRMFAVMALTPQHTHQVLTKRAERMRAYLRDEALRQRVVAQMQTMFGPGYPRSFYDDIRDWSENDGFPLPNVWLGVSVEDQQRADERIPVLLDTPAEVRWLSMEPLLGPVDLSPWLWGRAKPCRGCPGDVDCDCGFERRSNLDGEEVIDWVVLGGESGPGARPMSPEWARQVRDQCEHGGVPFHFKQWGDWGIVDPDAGDVNMDGWAMKRIGKRNAGRLLDRIQHDGYPKQEVA